MIDGDCPAFPLKPIKSDDGQLIWSNEYGNGGLTIRQYAELQFISALLPTTGTEHSIDIAKDAAERWLKQ